MQIDRPKRRIAPFSLRLSFEERERLEKLAAGESLSSFIKRHVFIGTAAPTKRGKAPVKDHKALGQLLALLGSSRLPQNMNQLAKAAHMGTLPLPDDVERDLKRACADIAAMRLLMMKALGIRIPDKLSEETTSQSFTRAAVPELRL